MREIKFRAWDKVAENMFIIFDANEQTEWFLPKWKDRYEVMQYTGLKDKNGVEIFEGDKLLYETKFENFDDTVDEITDIGVVKMNNKGCWVVDAGYADEDTLHDWVVDGAKIIGNIYENKYFYHRG